mmetsp:Transcript_31678/g.80401  ORF Transcript_31678/g.80401 Transcript_31678/m.80401 type:complete len:245 (-) Transcript_31678:141-875(-)
MSCPAASQTWILMGAPSTMTSLVKISGPAVGVYSSWKSSGSPPPNRAAKQDLPTLGSPSRTIFNGFPPKEPAAALPDDGPNTLPGTASPTGIQETMAAKARAAGAFAFLDKRLAIASKGRPTFLPSCAEVSKCSAWMDSQNDLTFGITDVSGAHKSTLQLTTTKVQSGFANPLTCSCQCATASAAERSDASYISTAPVLLPTYRGKLAAVSGSLKPVSQICMRTAPPSATATSLVVSSGDTVGS